MKKIVFGITSLELGGAERVLVDLTNRICSKYDITIFTIYGDGDLEKELNSKIEVINLINKKRSALGKVKKRSISLSFTSKRKLERIYNKYIKDNYDTEISFLEGPITSLFSFGDNNISWVHTDLSKHIKSKYRKKQYEKEYRKYKKIIFVSKSSLEGFNKIFNINNEKKIINNFINIESIIKKSNEYLVDDMKNDIPSFLSVCRLFKAKGIERLVKVSNKLLKDGYIHRIYIIGDGPEKSKISKLIKKYKISNNFILLGKKTNPYPYIKKADYFILPSIYEGFGMVLIEAIILCKNIIITDTGAKEALENYNNKLIVENTESGIYNGIKNILNKNIIFKKTKKIDYDLDKIINDIESIL